MAYSALFKSQHADITKYIYNIYIIQETNIIVDDSLFCQNFHRDWYSKKVVVVNFYQRD